MAFVPDQAIDEMAALSPAAFRLFVYLCRRRNRTTGACFPTLKRIASDCGLCYSYASEMRKELVSKGWVRLDSGGVIYPLKGFENEPEEVSENSEMVSDNPKVVSENPKTVSDNPKDLSENPKRYIKELTIEYNQHKNQDKKARPLPPDFAVSDALVAWFESKGFRYDRDTETEKFKNYHEAKGSKFKNWDAAWRNWMMNAEEFSNGKTKPVVTGRKTNAERLAEYADFFGETDGEGYGSNPGAYGDSQ